MPIHQAKAKICENSKRPEEFIQKYNTLKGKNCRELDALVYFLAEISDKSDIKQFLAMRPVANSTFQDTLNNTNAANGTSTSTGGSSSSKLSSTALAEMKEKVLKSTNSNVIQVSPSILNTLSKVIITEKTALRPKKETLLNCPEYPSWNQERPFLSWDFYPNPEKFESDSEINKLSLSLQENVIIEDLLNCMSGIEGKYIKTPSLIDKHAERTFHIDRSLDPAMREVAKRIVPVCANYSLIIRFVEGSY